MAICFRFWRIEVSAAPAMASLGFRRRLVRALVLLSRVIRHSTLSCQAWPRVLLTSFAFSAESKVEWEDGTEGLVLYGEMS